MIRYLRKKKKKGLTHTTRSTDWHCWCDLSEFQRLPRTHYVPCLKCLFGRRERLDFPTLTAHDQLYQELAARSGPRPQLNQLSTPLSHLIYMLKTRFPYNDPLVKTDLRGSLPRWRSSINPQDELSFFICSLLLQEGQCMCTVAIVCHYECAYIYIYLYIEQSLRCFNQTSGWIYTDVRTKSTRTPSFSCYLINCQILYRL